jgi:hypothetical protein
MNVVSDVTTWDSTTLTEYEVWLSVCGTRRDEPKHDVWGDAYLCLDAAPHSAVCAMTTINTPTTPSGKTKIGMTMGLWREDARPVWSYINERDRTEEV